MTAAPLAAAAMAVDIMVRATVLILAAWAAAAMLNRIGASAAARHLAWLFCIAGLLALPIVWWLAPPLWLPILPLEAAAAALAPPASPSTVPAIEAAATAGADASIVARLLLAAYLSGAAALLLRLAASHVLVWRLWRYADPAHDRDWQNLIALLSREMRLTCPVELRIARGSVMPMTWGTLAPKVLLPAEARGWPTDRRRYVLLHEIAHIARRDSLARMAGSLTCALYWFHPGVWFVARRMRLEQEHAADDRLLLLGASARGYAFNLLELARRVGEKACHEHVAAMASACLLERRVLAITTPTRRNRPGPASCAAGAAAAALVMLVTAAGMPVRPLPESFDTPSIESNSPSTRRMPATDEGRASVPVTAKPRDDARQPDSYGGAHVQRTAAMAEPVPTRSTQAREPQTGSPAASQAVPRGEPDRPDILSPSERREVYGPRLPLQLATEQALDPRIPEPLRSRNPRPPPHDDYAAGRTTGHRIVRGTLRVLSAVLMANSDAMP